MLPSCGVVLLGVAGFWALRLAWADRLSRSAELADRERAVRLVPQSASFRERLADKRLESGADPLPDLERAAELDPWNAGRCMRLATFAEMAGNLPLAEHSLLLAARLSRLYQPKYLLAQYYFRRGNADLFFRWSRAAFTSAYGDVTPLLDLCWRLRPNTAWLLESAIPEQPAVRRQFLEYLTARGDLEPAGNVANERLAHAADADVVPLLDYCDAALAAKRRDSCLAVWNALCRKRLLPHRELDPASGRVVTEDHFDSPPTGRGFDWRLQDLAGVNIAAFSKELRVHFSGRQPEECILAWEYVPVARGTRYQVTVEAEPVDALQIEGIEAALEGSAETGLLKLQLRYRRPSGFPRLEGTVAIRGVRVGVAP